MLGLQVWLFGSLLAHHVALHWAARVCGWQWHGHAHCDRRRGRGSGARVSGLQLHANRKIGTSQATQTSNSAHATATAA
eukprot:scaffold627_cov123-Isochrysis_galbana.AAC.8